VEDRLHRVLSLSSQPIKKEEKRKYDSLKRGTTKKKKKNKQRNQTV